MKLKLLFIILIQFLFCNLQSVIFSQSVQQVWVETVDQFNGSPIDAVIDTAGNIYITGGITYSGQGNNYITLKYNTNGVQQWMEIYNGPGSNSIDLASALAIDKFGNVYVTGNSEQTGFQTDAYCTIKYNTNGVQQWVARYKYTTNMPDDPSSIALDDSGNVYVTGTSNYIIGNLTTSDIVTIKYNNNGDSEWVKRFNGGIYQNFNYYNFGYSIAVDNNYNIYVGGSVYSGSPGDNHSCLIKYDVNGNLIWTSITGGSQLTETSKIKLDTNNNCIYAIARITNYGIRNYLTIKYNNSGIQQWIAVYSGLGNGDDIAYDFIIENSSNIYITGSSYDGNSFLDDYGTLKYNSNGDSLWVRRYDSPAHLNDDAYSIALDNQNNVYVTGSSATITGDSNICTIKYNTNGVQQWLIRLPGPGIWGYKIMVDKYNNVYVVGKQDINYNEIITTIKYSQLNGLEKISNNIPKQFNLSQNYPNPFNPTTKIKFNIPVINSPFVKGEPRVLGGVVKLIIYDILGREVATLVNDKLSPGTYEVEWDGSNYPSGVYFYKLEAGNYSESKKLVLIK